MSISANVVIPAREQKVYNIYGITNFAFNVNLANNKIAASLTLLPATETEWCLIGKRVSCNMTDLVSEVIALNDVDALAELQTVQQNLLSLTERLFKAKQLI